MRHSSARRVLALTALPFWLLGCPAKDNGNSGDDTSGSNGGDSGDSGNVNYDPGCITVDGAGGYAHLADAIAVASDGSTIALCDGTYEGTVTVDKGVTITGASQDGTILVGEATDPALRIAADGVSVSTLTVQGTYSGIIVEAHSGVSLSTLTFDHTGYWGLQIEGATDAMISGATFSEPDGGGVQISGGSATVADCVFDAPNSYGIQLENGAEGTLTGNTITGVQALSDDGSDGFGIDAEGATLTTDGNVIDQAGSIGIYADAATLHLANDTISTPGAIGIFAIDGSADVSGLAISGAIQEGAVFSAPAVTIADTTIDGDPNSTDEYTYARWGANGRIWYGALFLAADSATVTNLSTTAYNNYGIYVLPYSADATAEVTLDGVSVDNSGRWGLRVDNADTTATNVSVTNLREPELTTPCTSDGSTYAVDQSVSLFLYLGRFSLTGGTLATNQGWGISNYQSAINIEGVTFDGNACAQIINFAGVAQLTGNTFTHSAALGALWDYTGTSVLEGNTFTSNSTGAHYGPYDDGAGGTYEYEYSAGSGLDINAQNSSSIDIQHNTFENGDNSIILQGVTGTISHNTWTGYNGIVLENLQPPAGTPVEFSDNTVDDQGGYVVYTYMGDTDVQDVTIGTMRPFTYQFTWYSNGEVQYDYTSTSYPYVFYGYASSGSAANLAVDGVDIGTADYGVFNLYDGTASIHDMTVGSSGMTTGANFLTAYWTYNQPILDIDGLTVDEAGGSGVYLYNQGTATTDSYINLHDLNFGTLAGNAVSLTYINAYNLSDSDLGSPSGYGLYAYGPGTTGTSTIENVTVDGATGSGIYLSGGLPTVVGVHSSANSAAGIHLDSATATVTDSTFTSNGTYGMECSSVTFTACTNNDLSDNAYGEVSGCPDTCGIPDGGSDTGAP